MIIDIHRALIELYPDGAGYMQQGLQYSGLKWTDSRPKPTEAEIQAKIAELEALEPMRLLRLERNRRLTETDWRMHNDYPGSNQEKWKTYRQTLRDLPATAEPQLDSQGNLTNVVWPSCPENN
tara:strand:+ start:103 stop:471 length:369 start_codon:yes stop_codon:yes gene_type:complete